MLNNQKVFFEKINNYFPLPSLLLKAGKLNVSKRSALLMPKLIFAT